jgi:cytochrome P450
VSFHHQSIREEKHLVVLKTNMLPLILLVGLILFVIYRFIKFWIFDPWFIQRGFQNQGIPGQYIPIVGDIFNRRRAFLTDNPLAYSEESAAKFGDYYYGSMGPVAYLTISDPSLIEGVLKTNVRAYHKSALGQTILGSILGYDNILLAEDENHTRHRRLIAPVFQHQNINSMIALMTERTSRFLDKWTTSMDDKSQPLTLDIHEEMTNLTLDIITGCVFGTDIIKDKYVHETISRNVTVALKEIEKRVFNMLALIPIIKQLPLPGKRLIDQSRQKIKQVVENIINQRKKGLTKSACKGLNTISFVFSYLELH